MPISTDQITELRERLDGHRPISRADIGGLLDEIDELRSRLAGADAAHEAATEWLAEHTELTGHIEVAEQCRDYLAHEMADNVDPSGKLQDFVDSLRIVIDQLDRQRRGRNWYKVAYTASKQKLIESALSKVTTELVAMTAARDELAEIAERLADLECDSTAENRIAELAKVGQ